MYLTNIADLEKRLAKYRFQTKMRIQGYRNGKATKEYISSDQNLNKLILRMAGITDYYKVINDIHSQPQCLIDVPLSNQFYHQVYNLALGLNQENGYRYPVVGKSKAFKDVNGNPLPDYEQVLKIFRDIHNGVNTRIEGNVAEIVKLADLLTTIPELGNMYMTYKLNQLVPNTFTEVFDALLNDKMDSDKRFKAVDMPHLQIFVHKPA